MIATSYHDERTPGVEVTIHLYCYAKARIFSWTEQRQSSPRRPPTSTKGSASFKTAAETVAAFEARCADLEASGWRGGRRRGDVGVAKKPAPAAKVEAALEAVTVKLAKALTAARRNAVKERAALAKALEGYRAARGLAGEPPDDHVIHFFAADGVGLQKARTPAFQRLSADGPTVARWTAILEELVRGGKAVPPKRRREGDDRS